MRHLVTDFKIVNGMLINQQKLGLRLKAPKIVEHKTKPLLSGHAKNEHIYAYCIRMYKYDCVKYNI